MRKGNNTNKRSSSWDRNHRKNFDITKEALEIAQKTIKNKAQKINIGDLLHDDNSLTKIFKTTLEEALEDRKRTKRISVLTNISAGTLKKIYANSAIAGKLRSKAPLIKSAIDHITGNPPTQE